MLAVLVFFSSFETQLVVNDNLKRKLNIIFPEGWGFFTKNPRDLGLEVYKIENNKLIKQSTRNNCLKEKAKSQFKGFFSHLSTQNKINPVANPKITLLAFDNCVTAISLQAE